MTQAKVKHNKNDLFNTVTNKIIEALEKGVSPWKQTWTTQGAGGLPQNAITGRPYSGINVILLWLEAYDKHYRSNRWLTFKQALDAGGNVKKGEKSSLVIMCKPFIAPALDSNDQPMLDENGDEILEDKMYTTSFHLFNIDQCENLPERITHIPEGILDSDIERIEQAEQLVAASGLSITHKYQSNACYRPSTDKILMPLATQFDTVADYYATLLHEMVHATGHKNRLSREAIMAKKTSDKQVYAFEELVAEIGAAFLCAHLNIQGDVQHESYIASWLKVLKEDNKAIFRASRLAREAFEYLVNQEQADLQAA